MGISTVSELRELPEQWFKQNMTIQGQRLWNELWERPCIPFDKPIETARCITCSRSFGNYVEEINILCEAITQHASRVAEKLRRAKLRCMYLQTFFHTNGHRQEDAQHYPAYTVKLSIASSNTHDIVKTATITARSIFKEGYRYRKCGVIATGLIDESELQLNLFKSYNGDKLDTVSQVIDKINLAYGRNTLRMASEDYTKTWRLKNHLLSKRYTTNWDDIIKAK